MSTCEIAMKVLVLLAFVSLGQCALLGSRKCTYGPSYWCSHVDHARECKTMQHCMATVWKNQLQGLTGSTEGCFDVIQTVDDVRHGPNLLEKMAESCTKMTTEKRSVCKELMKNNANEVLLLLQSDLPSANIASVLGLCGRSSDAVQQPPVEIKQGIQQSGNYCSDCLNFFQDLQEIVNNTGERIEKELKEKVCVHADYFEKLCNDTVDTYVGFLFTLLTQQLNPQDVCFLFRLCASSTQHDFMKKVKAIFAKPQYNAVVCDVCKDIVQVLQDAFRDTAFQNDTLMTLENKVCPVLPGDLAALCKTFVSQYGPLVFQVVVAELNPEDMCSQIKLCASKTPHDFMKTVKAAVVKAKGSAECDVCMDLAKDLQNALRDTTLQNEILSTLENKACPLLPGNLSTQCKTYVSMYGPLVFEVLVAELDPQTICQTLGLCNSTKMEDKPGLVLVPLSKAVTNVRLMSPQPEDQAQFSPQCEFCTFVMEKLESIIGTNATEEEILAGLEKVCSLLPQEYAATCDGFVQEYGKAIVELLLEEIAPQAVCTALGLCVGDQPVHVAHPEVVKSGEMCKGCEEVVGYIRKYINDPQHAKTIEELVDEVCVLVPASYRAECLQIVNTYEPLLINQLNKYDDPQKLCTQLNLCNGTKTESNASGSASKPLLFMPMAELQPAMSPVQCSQGPEVWCATIHNARRCNAVQYCVENKKLKLDG